MKNVLPLAKYVGKLFVISALILVTFSYAMFQGGFVSWFLFYSFLPFAFYAICLAFYPFDEFAVERKITRREYQANEEVKVQVTLKRRLSFPLLFILVEDCLSESMNESVQEKKNKHFYLLGFRKEFSFEYSIEKLPRGEHEWQAIRMMTSDLFGLIEKEKRIKLEEKILVYPAYEELMEGSFVNANQGMDASQSRIQRETSMVVGIRDYQSGDRLSWIDWKASAKRNGMVTKEFEQSQSRDVFMVMDCVPDRRFEIIVSFTASLGRALLRKGIRVGFLSVHNEKVIIPIHGGEASRQQLFYQLAQMKDHCFVPFDRVLETESFLLQQKATFMLVTAHLSISLIEAAKRCTTRNCPIIIFVIKSADDFITVTEQSMKAMANVHGMRVAFVYEGKFSVGLSEVGRR